MKLKLQTVTVMQDNSKHMWVCSYSFLRFSSQLKIKLLTGKHFIGKKWHDESVSKDGQKGHSTLIIVEMLSVMNTNKYKVSQRTNKAHTETVHNERHDLTHSRLLANFDRQIPRSANDLIILFYSHYFGTGFHFFGFLQYRSKWQMEMMSPFCVQQQPVFSPITFSNKVAHPKEWISD